MNKIIGIISNRCYGDTLLIKKMKRTINFWNTIKKEIPILKKSFSMKDSCKSVNKRCYYNIYEFYLHYLHSDNSPNLVDMVTFRSFFPTAVLKCISIRIKHMEFSINTLFNLDCSPLTASASSHFSSGKIREHPN